MKIDIITIFPDMFTGIFEFGVIGKGITAELFELNIHDLRNWSENRHKQIDDRPYGGGPGMILMAEPLGKAIESLKTDKSVVILTTPSGVPFEQEIAEHFSKENHLIIICGRYEGIDQRIIELYVDYEISIGSYVLSGGEIPAMVIIDAVARLIPGVIQNNSFNENESFSDPENRKKLDFPQYTRPPEYKGLNVPEVLLSGNHNEIKKWREQNRNLLNDNL